MTVEELQSKGAVEFLTEGPNSGGVRGYYYLEGKVYSFWHDFGSSAVESVENAMSFIKRNISHENPREREAALGVEKLINNIK